MPASTLAWWLNGFRLTQFADVIVQRARRDGEREPDDDQDLRDGSELDIMLTLPAEMTNGEEVLVKASGKVVRVEERLEDGSLRRGVAAIIERYDIMRGSATA